MAQYLATIPVTLRDADYMIGVTDYSYKAGTHSYNAPSDLDYYGWEDMDFDILTEDESSVVDIELTADEKATVEEAIRLHMDDQRDNERAAYDERDE
jgi:outer membrane receptor for monomeric catechols